ncbi:hypothetical protein V6N13_076066 [Hibiscus sabdariffa]
MKPWESRATIPETDELEAELKDASKLSLIILPSGGNHFTSLIKELEAGTTIDDSKCPELKNNQRSRRCPK